MHLLGDSGQGDGQHVTRIALNGYSSCLTGRMHHRKMEGNSYTFY